MILRNNRFVYSCTHQESFNVVINSMVTHPFVAEHIDEDDNWQQNLWVMGLIGKPGATLVEALSQFFTFTVRALQTIKDGVTVDGVKEAGEFIANNILLPIVEDVKSFFINLLHTIFYTISAQYSINVATQSNGGIITFAGITRFIKMDITPPLDLVLNFDGVEEFRILTPYLFPRIELPETLGVNPQINSFVFFALNLVIEFLAFSMLVAPSKPSGYGLTPISLEAKRIGLVSIVTQTLLNLFYIIQISPEEARWMAYYHRGSVVALALLQLLLASSFGILGLTMAPSLAKIGGYLLSNLIPFLANPEGTISNLFPSWASSKILPGIITTLIVYLTPIAIRLSADVGSGFVTSFMTISLIPDLFSYFTLMIYYHYLLVIVYRLIAGDVQV